MTKNSRYDRLDNEFSDSLNSLSFIQAEFDEYQKLKFSERTPEFFCLELNGEAGELANLEKKAWKGREIPDEKFQDEVADVFIALMNYCNARQINLSEAVLTKLLKIERMRIELEEQGKKY